MATTINIDGVSNDTNLVLGSANATISDNNSPLVVPNVADTVLAGRMFLGGNLLFYFLSATQMVRLRIHPDISYNNSDLTNKNWWLNDDNVITDFVYEFDSAVYDASQNVHLRGSLVSLTPVSSDSQVFTAFQWKNTIISSSSLRVPAGDMTFGTTTPTTATVLPEITNEVALPTSNDLFHKVTHRGNINIGLNGEMTGFSKDTNGVWSGFDYELSKAFAYVLFNGNLGTNNSKLAFSKLTADNRITKVLDDSVDVVFRNTTNTFERDICNNLSFGPTVFYDGGQVIIKKSDISGILNDPSNSSLNSNQNLITLQHILLYLDKNNKKFAVQPLTTTSEIISLEANALDISFGKIKYEVTTAPDAIGALNNGSAICYASDAGGLKSTQTAFAPALDDFTIILDNNPYSREPLAPYCKDKNPIFTSFLGLTMNTLILAWEQGLTSSNIETDISGKSTKIKNVFTNNLTLHSFGLDKNLLLKLVKNNGNFKQIFDRNLNSIGINSVGLNRLYTDGGLFYPYPN